MAPYGRGTGYLIYGLVDPRTMLIRYIGKSCEGLRRTLRHRYEARRGEVSYKANWIRLLWKIGSDYSVVVLESMATRHGLGNAERWWIAYGRASGWPLTNRTDGGEGGLPGMARDPNTRARIGAASRERMKDPAVRARIAELAMGNTRTRGQKRTPEQRARFSEAQRRRFALKPHSQETRDKISAAKLARRNVA